MKVIRIPLRNQPFMNWLAGLCAQWWMRLISFVLAVFMSTIIFIFPQAIAADTTQLNHGLLSMMLIAVCACFVHGVGFVTHSRMVNYLISPLLTLPVLGIIAWRLWG